MAMLVGQEHYSTTRTPIKGCLSQQREAKAFYFPATRGKGWGIGQDSTVSLPIADAGLTHGKPSRMIAAELITAVLIKPCQIMDNPPNEQSPKHSSPAIFAFVSSLLAAIFLAMGLMTGRLGDHDIIAGLIAALISLVLAVAALLKRKNKKRLAVFAITISLLTAAAFVFIAISALVIFGMLVSLLLGR